MVSTSSLWEAHIPFTMVLWGGISCHSKCVKSVPWPLCTRNKCSKLSEMFSLIHTFLLTLWNVSNFRSKQNDQKNYFGGDYDLHFKTVFIMCL